MTAAYFLGTATQSNDASICEFVAWDSSITEAQIIDAGYTSGASFALLASDIPLGGALTWPESVSSNDAALPASGATKVVIRA